MTWLKAHWKALAVTLALLLAVVWYSRPVDIYTLAPGLKEPNTIDFTLRELGTAARNTPSKASYRRTRNGTPLWKPWRPCGSAVRRGISSCSLYRRAPSMGAEFRTVTSTSCFPLAVQKKALCKSNSSSTSGYTTIPFPFPSPTGISPSGQRIPRKPERRWRKPSGPGWKRSNLRFT